MKTVGVVLVALTLGLGAGWAARGRENVQHTHDPRAGIAWDCPACHSHSGDLLHGRCEGCQRVLVAITADVSSAVYSQRRGR